MKFNIFKKLKKPDVHDLVHTLFWGSSVSERKEARLKLIELGQQGNKEVIDVLVANLSQENIHFRDSIGEILVEIGYPAVDSLISALNDYSWVTIQAAAVALGEIGDDRAVDILIQKLENYGSEKTGWAFAEALGDIGDNRAVEVLITCLQAPHIRVQRAAAWALGRIKDKRAIEPLKSSLNNVADHQFQNNVMQALNEIGSN